MSRQQNRVLQAMILRREFTAQDLHEHSGVTPGTIRTVIKRFQSALELVGRVSTGKPGGRIARYRLRPDRVDQLIDKVLELAPVAPNEVDEERNRLLELTSAHHALVVEFGNVATASEQNDLLNLVASDIAVARQHLASLRQDDPRFGRCARRIEEVSQLYSDRQELLARSDQTDQELAQLGKAVNEAATNLDAPSHAIRLIVINVDNRIGLDDWSVHLCRDLDRVSALNIEQFQYSSDPNGIYTLPWADGNVGGCILTVDSSVIPASDIRPAMEFMGGLPRVLPILVLDAREDFEFRTSVSALRGFYVSQARGIDAHAVLHLYLQIVQSLRVAHGLLIDRTVRRPRLSESFPKQAERGYMSDWVMGGAPILGAPLSRLPEALKASDDFE